MDIFVAVPSIKKTIRDNGMSPSDLPEFVRQLGFRGLELSDRDLNAYDSESLGQFARNCRDTQCGAILDVNSDLTYSDQMAWGREVAHVKEMLGVARELGAKCARICLGGQSLSIQKLWRRRTEPVCGEKGRATLGEGQGHTIKEYLLNRWMLQLAHAVRKGLPSHVRKLEDKLARAITALEEITPLAESCGIPLVIENHWGISSRPQNILRVLDAINSPWLGTCPDFGNFPRDVDVYEGLALLAPKALHAQAKSTSFHAGGEEKSIDYKRALRIFRESGYDDTFTVEYQGLGDDLNGCLRTRELIIRYW